MLFNSYYNAVGDKHPRPQRGLLSRPSLDAIDAYRSHVDAGVRKLLAAPRASEVLDLLELGLNHEQQHQELVLTDVKHMLSCNPLRPAYARAGATREAADAPPLEWIEFAAGVVEIGHDGFGFAFDNETPRHRQYLDPFALGSRLVTNAEYAEFMADDGYRRPELWLVGGLGLAEREPDRGAAVLGKRWRLAGIHAARHAAARTRRTASATSACSKPMPMLAGRVRGCRRKPSGKSRRRELRVEGQFVESGALRPRPAAPGDARLTQLFGDVWQWTQSAYAAYPGFRARRRRNRRIQWQVHVQPVCAARRVVRDSRSHIRPSYRNFFPAAARWQFSGLRLARDS